MGQQILLTPSKQRRNQQIGKIEIIARLHAELQRGNQILDGKWRAQPQPVNPCHRHPFCMEPRDDQRGERTTFAHQHHDVAGRCPTRATLAQPVTLIQP
jgi:hypothetical protein